MADNSKLENLLSSLQKIEYQGDPIIISNEDEEFQREINYQINMIIEQLNNVDVERNFEDEYIDSLIEFLKTIQNGHVSFDDAVQTINRLKDGIEIARNRMKQIDEISDRIKSREEKMENIATLYDNLEQNKLYLEEYVDSKLLPPWLYGDKTYKEIKEVIKYTSKILENYRIKDSEDLSKRMNALKDKKKLVKSLSKLKNGFMKLLKPFSLSQKVISKTVKTQIIQKHPELENFVNFLLCEDAVSLYKLREDHDFKPESIKDFVSEFKKCKRELNQNKDDKKLQEKFKLLDKVSNTLYKNLMHQKGLDRGYNIPVDKTQRQMNF